MMHTIRLCIVLAVLLSATGRCRSQCLDSSGYCAVWGKQGYCATTLAFRNATVVQRCPRTCRRCNHSPAAQTANLALGKPAFQSSSYPGSPANGIVPGDAVDGNTNGSFSSGSCAHSGFNETMPWWAVDLGTTAPPVGSVLLYNRLDCCQTRLRYVEIRVGDVRPTVLTPPRSTGNTLCALVTGPFGSLATANCTGSIAGRFVSVQLVNTSLGVQNLTLCEVQVFGKGSIIINGSPASDGLLAGFKDLAMALARPAVTCNPCFVGCNVTWVRCPTPYGGVDTLELNLGNTGIGSKGVRLDNLTAPLNKILANAFLPVAVILDANVLTGTLPAAWGSMINLAHLFLSGNRLSGTLPVSWGGMSDLVDLGLNRNSLTGPLPVEWKRLTNLETLDLRFNNLTGTLPPDWSSLTRLKAVSFASNPRVVGFIPPQWEALYSLTSLGVNGTGVCDAPQVLQGVALNVPPCSRITLGSMLYLQLGQPASLDNPLGRPGVKWLTNYELNIAAAGITRNLSDIAPTLVKIGALGVLSMNLSNNAFKGPVPWQILFPDCNNTSPTSVSFRNNALTGHLPDTLVLPPFLDLSRNKLTGELSERLVLLRNASHSTFTLNLDYNKLYGSIPQSWTPVLDNSVVTISGVGTQLCLLYGLRFPPDLPVCNGTGLPDPVKITLSTPAGTSSYFLFAPDTWPRALTTCARRGGSLLLPASLEQYTQLVNALDTLNNYKYGYQLPIDPVYSTQVTFSGMWLGMLRAVAGNDMAFCPGDDVFWLNGTKVASAAAPLNKFVSPQPSNFFLSECCGAVSLQLDNSPQYTWFMFSCQAKLPFLCVQQDCITSSSEGAGSSLIAIAAKYGTTPWQIWQDNPSLFPLRSWTAPGPLRLCPGVDGTRFNRAGRSPTGVCLSELSRPCAGVTPEALQADCFCSYHEDGSYSWPFAPPSKSCTAFVMCRGLLADGGVQYCGTGRIFNETAAGTAVGRAAGSVPVTGRPGSSFCTPLTGAPATTTPTCSDRCGGPECVCYEWLLGAGTYFNSFDTSGNTGITCNALGSTTGQLTCSKPPNTTFEDPLVAQMVFFDARTGQCSRTPPRCQKPLETYGGCEYTYIEQFDPDSYNPTPAPSGRRRLLWGGAASSAGAAQGHAAMPDVDLTGLSAAAGMRTEDGGLFPRPGAGFPQPAGVFPQPEGVSPHPQGALWRNGRRLHDGPGGTAPGTVNSGSCNPRGLRVAQTLGCVASATQPIVAANARFPNCFCKYNRPGSTPRCPEAVLGQCSRSYTIPR